MSKNNIRWKYEWLKNNFRQITNETWVASIAIHPGIKSISSKMLSHRWKRDHRKSKLFPFLQLKRFCFVSKHFKVVNKEDWLLWMATLLKLISSFLFILKSTKLQKVELKYKKKQMYLYLEKSMVEKDADDDR